MVSASSCAAHGERPAGRGQRQVPLRRAGRHERGAQADPCLMVAIPPVERRRRPYRAELPPRSRPGHHADPHRRTGAAEPARAARRSADQHHPDRRGRAGADQADRATTTSSGTWTASSWPPASATPRSSSAPTASAPRWRPAARPTSSATSTTPSTWRIWPAPASPLHDPVSGKTVGAIDLTCWRKDADPLLITLVKSTADQISRPCWPTAQQPGARAAAGVPSGLPAGPADRARARQRRRHAERPRPRRCSTPATRPPCSATPPRRWPGVNPARRSRSTCPAASIARMYCRAHLGSSEPARRRRGPREAGRRPAGRRARGAGRAVRRCTCPAWSAAARCGCARAVRSRPLYDSGDWMTLEGEPGVGKLALARAVHQRRNPAAPFHVLDAARRSPGLAGQGPPRAARRRGHAGDPARRPARPPADARAGQRAAGGAARRRRAARPTAVGRRSRWTASCQRPT